MKRLCAVVLVLALSSCDWIGRQADALGEHMPVIGERCEHWQCVTPEGQAESDAGKQQQMQNQPKPLVPPPPAAADNGSPR